MPVRWDSWQLQQATEDEQSAPEMTKVLLRSSLLPQAQHAVELVQVAAQAVSRPPQRQVHLHLGLSGVMARSHAQIMTSSAWQPCSCCYVPFKDGSQTEKQAHPLLQALLVPRAAKGEREVHRQAAHLQIGTFISCPQCDMACEEPCLASRGSIMHNQLQCSQRVHAPPLCALCARACRRPAGRPPAPAPEGHWKCPAPRAAGLH